MKRGTFESTDRGVILLPRVPANAWCKQVFAMPKRLVSGPTHSQLASHLRKESERRACPHRSQLTRTIVYAILPITPSMSHIHHIADAHIHVISQNGDTTSNGECGSRSSPEGGHHAQGRFKRNPRRRIPGAEPGKFRPAGHLISIQSFEPFGGAHTAEARMKADPTPKHCYLEFDKWYCVLE